MSNLANVLQANGIDTSTLRTLLESDRGATYGLKVSGAEAIAMWEKLRQLVPKTGHWPVLIGGKEDFESLQEMSQLEGSTADILAQSNTIDPAAWFGGRGEQRQAQMDRGLEMLKEMGGDADILGELRKRMKDAFGESFEPDDPRNAGETPHGEWPDDAEPSHEFSTPYNVTTGNHRKLILMGLVPTQAPWEVPAILSYGGFNLCPQAHEHVAVMRYWNQKHGAEPLAMTHDVVEMKVARPPETREAALTLAEEQYAYCNDIVDQGTETVEALAASLVGGTAWYFWWD